MTTLKILQTIEDNLSFDRVTKCENYIEYEYKSSFNQIYDRVILTENGIELNQIVIRDLTSKYPCQYRTKILLYKSE